MSENPPLLKPNSELDRTAVEKVYKNRDYALGMKNFFPYLQKLEDLDLIPQTIGYREDEDGLHVFMERVNGFDLANIPPTHEDYKFSVDLAKKAASLCQDFFVAGYHHVDLHSNNIMYDLGRGKCVAVDLDSIGLNKNHEIPLKTYVEEYAELMADIYLGDMPTLIAEKMLQKGELLGHMGEEWKEFKDTVGMYNNPNQIDIRDLIGEDLPRIALLLMKIKGVESKIHPAIKAFILRGLNPATCPQNFDQILRLDSQKDNM